MLPEHGQLDVGLEKEAPPGGIGIHQLKEIVSAIV